MNHKMLIEDYEISGGMFLSMLLPDAHALTKATS